MNNRERVRDLWLDTMRIAADAANPFASTDPAALAMTFAAGAHADPGALLTPEDVSILPRATTGQYIDLNTMIRSDTTMYAVVKNSRRHLPEDNVLTS